MALIDVIASARHELTEWRRDIHAQHLKEQAERA